MLCYVNCYVNKQQMPSCNLSNIIYRNYIMCHKEKIACPVFCLSMC